MVTIDRRTQVGRVGGRDHAAAQLRLERLDDRRVVGQDHGGTVVRLCELHPDVGTRAQMQHARLLRPKPLPRIPLPLGAAVVAHRFGCHPHCRQAQGFAEEAVVGPQRCADDTQTAEHEGPVFEQMYAKFARAFAARLKFFSERPAVEFVVARHRGNLGARIGGAHRLDCPDQALAGISRNKDELGIACHWWKAAGPRKVQMHVGHDLSLLHRSLRLEARLAELRRQHLFCSSQRLCTSHEVAS